MPIDSPSSSSFKSSLILETYFPKLAGDNGRCSSIQQTECACPCCVLCTPSRAAKRPLAASLSAPPVGSQALLDRFGFRGAANDLEMFSVLTGKKRIQLRSQITPMQILKVLRALTYVAMKRIATAE